MARWKWRPSEKNGSGKRTETRVYPIRQAIATVKVAAIGINLTRKLATCFVEDDADRRREIETAHFFGLRNGQIAVAIFRQQRLGQAS